MWSIKSFGEISKGNTTGRVVVVRKSKKVSGIFIKFGTDISEQEFAQAFMDKYLKNWKRIQQVYANKEKLGQGKATPLLILKHI